VEPFPCSAALPPLKPTISFVSESEAAPGHTRKSEKPRRGYSTPVIDASGITDAVVMSVTSPPPGEIFIEVTEDDGGAFMATVGLVRRYGEHSGERGVWLKTYAEYEGLPQALARAGVLKITGRTYTIPAGEAVHAVLTDLAYWHLHRWNGSGVSDVTTGVA
jgi:hypothetical protein